MKILINLPADRTGGVANHFLGLRNKFIIDAEFNFIGGLHKQRFFLLRQIKHYLDFVSKIRKNKPDIVHLNPSLDIKAIIRDGFYLFISILFKKKVLVFWHGWEAKTQKMFEVSAIKRKLFISVYKRADGMIVLAKEFQNKLNEWGFKNPIFLETTKVDDDLLRNFDINSKNYSSNKILFLARAVKDKGIFETYKTYEILAEEYPDLSLYIAGDGDALNEVKIMVKPELKNRIHFLGYIHDEEKAKALTETTIYLFPTFWDEGMPTSLLEAMAFGLAVVSRPVGGTKDFFENGKMGYLTESDDPCEYAKIISKLINNKDKIKEIGLYNHTFSTRKFMATSVARRLEKIYDQIAR